VPADRAGVEERLALAETLNACIDAGEAAQRALEWLGTHAGVVEGLCLTLDADGRKLVCIAAFGTTPAHLEIDLDGREDPLATAFAQGAPCVVARRPRGRRAGASISPVLTLPLEDHAKAALGLLVLTPPSAIAREVGGWVAGLLARTVARALVRRTLEDTERRLRRERGLLYRIINAVSDPILLTDREERIVIANARAEALFAAREDESEGRRRAVSLNNMLFSAALSRGVFEDIASVRHELPLVDPHEGEDLLFELIGTPVVDDSGTEGVVSILRNVTDLRLATAQIQENYDKLRAAEAEVRAERDRLDLIIDSVADPIVATDPTGNVVMLNAPAERLFTAPPDARGEVVSRVRANDAHFTSFIAAGFLTGSETRYRGEISLLDPVTGATIPVEAVCGKIFSLHGELTAIVTILHDRTEELEKARLYEELKRSSEQLEHKVRAATAELVRHNELLRRQHIELEQASALKSQFLANMSHEFRTPLNAILGYTSMLLQGVSGDVSAQQKRSLSRIDSNARHLLAIINDILDIARIEAGKMPLTISDFQVSELIDEVAAELEPLIARSPITVKVETPASLPAVRSDRQKVKQIVLNLLSNALKFTSEGWVRVAAGHEGDHVVITVEDTGIGIAPADQERIFEDFRQADSSPTREYGGAGLGLAICRRLAVMLDGRITLESALGKGSTFGLVLPARPKRR
jgi:PAS domain S-box-containing protein